MAQQTPTFPDVPQTTQTIALDGVQYLIRMTWRARTNSWYLDFWHLDETPIVLGRRMSPKFSPTMELELEATFPGYLTVFGSADPYPRESLEDDLRLVHYTLAELLAVPRPVDPFEVQVY